MADQTEEKPAEAARHEATDIGEELREKGAEAARSARDTARKYAERAKEEAYTRGEHYRDYAADETGKVASALRRASQDLNSGSPQERLLGQLADGVADAAERMRGMTVADIARDTTDFARRHPAAYLGSAALLGFAAARFLKATSHHETLYLPQTQGSPAQGTSTSAPGAAGQPSAPGAAGQPSGTSAPSPGTPAETRPGSAPAPGTPAYTQGTPAATPPQGGSAPTSTTDSRPTED